MEPDDLLCSRNARPEKALVGRAQWKIDSGPIPEEITGERGRIISMDENCSMRVRPLLGEDYENPSPAI